MFFLIGHRGVGKTTLVNEFAGAVDLDTEISKNADIDLFFKDQNEQGFRKEERACLQRLIECPEVSLVALGAGFELDNFDFPEGSVFIWIQRRSDLKGRVFLNRPRLDDSLTPLEEYFSRFNKRQELYASKADFCLELSEGASLTSSVLNLRKIIEGRKIKSAKAYYTLESEKDLKIFSGALELRTDFLDESTILKVLRKKNENSYLLSFKNTVSDQFLEEVFELKNCIFDLPLENREFVNLVLRKRADRGSFFLSCHRNLSEEEWAFVEATKLHLKWAPEIRDFVSLKPVLSKLKGQDVSFLPRDPEGQGRWKWLRESLFSQNKINFYRTGLGKYLDQVTLDDLEPLEMSHVQNMGAVLGEQIFLSKSPGFHKQFFIKTFKSFYSSIPMSRYEFNKENLELIESFGYRFFSVTAPFKGQMDFLGSDGPVNTLVLNKKKNVFLDTDRIGLKAIVDRVGEQERTLIWGAGVMGQALKSLLGDKADILPVRAYKGEELSGFDVVIWCAGADVQSPNFRSLPKKIFDLEYKEQSKAKQVALALGTEYISGDDLFIKQAEAQQSFWLNSVEEF